MKHGLVMVMSTMVVLTASANAQAQGQGRGGAPACTTVQCDVLGDWGRGYALLIGVAEAMPEDKFGFKPTPAQESFAQRLMHVAGIDLKLVSTLGGKTSPPICSTTTSTPRLLVSLRTSAGQFGFVESTT